MRQFEVFGLFSLIMFILLLCPFLVVGVQTLTIDSQLGTSVEDCFERIAIGEQLPSSVIYRNVSELTIKECEHICKQDKQCQAYDYGVGAKGNATCNLSQTDEKEIKEKSILLRHPDYDVYVRRFQCEQSPPTPIQPLKDEQPGHRPIFRPDIEERPLSDYVVSGDINYRPDSNPGPDFNGPPSYGDHRPQEIPYKPERPDKDPYKPSLDPYKPGLDPYKPNQEPYKPNPDPYKPTDPYRPNPDTSYRPDRPNNPYRPNHHRPNDKFRPERPQDGYRPKPDATDELEFQGYNKPNDKPDLYRPEKPAYQYIVRPNRRPHFKPGQDNYDGPIGPPEPYRPSRPHDRPYDYNHQYASSYGPNAPNDNSVYLHIYDPPRPYIPIKDRPNHPNYKPGFLGYGTYSDQHTHSGSFIGSITEIGYNQNQNSPTSNYGQIDGGYGLQRPNDRPKGDKGTYGPNYNYGGNQNYGSSNQYGGFQDYGSNSHGYGGSSQNYGSNSQNYASSNQGYGSTNHNYDSNTQSYGNRPSDYNNYGSNYNKPDKNKDKYENNKGSYGHNSQSNYDSGYQKPDRPGYGQSKPESIGYGQSKPETVGYGQSKPETSGYGQSKPGTLGYGQSKPETLGYGQSKPETSGYGQSKPESTGYGQLKPETLGYGQIKPETSGYGQPKPETSGYDQQKPIKPTYPDKDQGYYGSNSYGSGQSIYGSSQNAYGSFGQSSWGSYGQSGGGYLSTPSGYGSSNGNYDNYNTRPNYGNKKPAYGNDKPSYETGYTKPDYDRPDDYQKPTKPNYNPPDDYQKPINDYPKPDYDYQTPGYEKPSGQKPGKKPVYDYEKPNSDYDKPYEDERPSYGEENYDPDRPDVKPVYEYEMHKPGNTPAYIAKPSGEIVTSRPVVIGDYGERHSYKDNGKETSFKACFRRVLAGKRALRSFVRKVFSCETLEDCRRECATEKRFHCESFNYRIAISYRSKGLCELMTQPIEAFDIHRDFVEDKNYDFYEIDRNSLEPNCPETLGGPGKLHSGFLSSKPNRIEGWRDRNWDRNGDRNGDRRYYNERGNAGYGGEGFIPYQIGQIKTDYREKWGQYGGNYGGTQYTDKNEYHKSVNHWGLSTETPVYGVRPLTYEDFKTFNYNNLARPEYNIPKRYDFERKIDKHDHTLKYTPATNFYPLDFPHEFPGIDYATTIKDFPTIKDFSTTIKDFPSTLKEFTPAKEITISDFHTTRGDHRSLGKGDTFFHTTGISEVDFDHRKGEHDELARKWSDSGEVGFEVEDKSFLAPIDKNDVGLENECIAQRTQGMTITTGTIRRALYAHNVVDCEAKCFSEKEFKCVSYSFRYTSSSGSDNCFLSERPFRGLEMSADSSSDVYAMPPDADCANTFNHWVESECFWHVRSDSSVTGTAVKTQLTVAGLGACEAECIRAQGFFCRGFSFRFEPAPPIESDFNCVLTSSPPTKLSPENIRSSPGHELYARGNFGRGCEPATYDDVKDIETCYLQYDKAAALWGGALRGTARVVDQRACAAACTHAPFRCLTFSYKTNAAPDAENCFLSDIRLFDLKRDVDFVHSVDDWLFSFDIFNARCWKELFKDKPAPELPRPILRPLEEVHHPTNSPPPTFSNPDKDLTTLPWSEYSIPPRTKPPEEHFSKPSFYFELNPTEYTTGSGFKLKLDKYSPEKERPFPIYGPINPNKRPDIETPQKPPIEYWPGSGLKETGFTPALSGYSPNEPKWPEYLPNEGKPTTSQPFGNDISTGNPVEKTWRQYTVSGLPCRAGTFCAQNHITGHWACEPEGGEIGSWDYCCAPNHRCGYSEGFYKPWCYVGHKQEQWRPCSDKYFPYHHHKGPHPSVKVHPTRKRPWRDTPTTSGSRPYIPHWDKPPGRYLPEEDQKYWDDLYKDGPKAYYDDTGRPLPGYSRVPPNIGDRRPPNSKQGHFENGQWVAISQQFGPVGSELGEARYWPVAYLHKSPPPNMTYFRYNENVTQTDKTSKPNRPKPKPESRNFDIPLDNTSDYSKKTNIDVKKDNEPNITKTDTKYQNATKDQKAITNVTVPSTEKSIFATTANPEIEANITETESEKSDNYTDFDTIKGIDDKLGDLTESIEVLDLEDAKGDKLSELKTLEAEEKQIEAIGRLVASRRGNSLVLQKRSQKEMEDRSIAVDKDTVEFNFGNRFSTSERRGVVKKISKFEIDREKNRDRSLEVSETTFVRPPRVLTTTENIRKAIVNGKVFYDATIKENTTIANNTRKGKNLRRLELLTPSVINNSTYGRKKIVKTRNSNPVRRVKRVYRKRYNPDEVRRRLLEREKSGKDD